MNGVSASTTSSSTWRKTNRSEALGRSAPGNRWASHRTWKPLQMPRTRPPARANAATSSITGACPTERLLSIPVKHTTGRFYAPEADLDWLEASGQVLLKYAAGQNPNGSLRDIAGVCNEAGNVFGLMPHPEHAVDALGGSVDGLKIFESMRAHVEQHVLA